VSAITARAGGRAGGRQSGGEAAEERRRAEVVHTLSALSGQVDAYGMQLHALRGTCEERLAALGRAAEEGSVRLRGLRSAHRGARRAQVRARHARARAGPPPPPSHSALTLTLTRAALRTMHDARPCVRLRWLAGWLARRRRQSAAEMGRWLEGRLEELLRVRRQGRHHEVVFRRARRAVQGIRTRQRLAPPASQLRTLYYLTPGRALAERGARSSTMPY
jgi:hypothetical protein